MEKKFVQCPTSGRQVEVKVLPPAPREESSEPKGLEKLEAMRIRFELEDFLEGGGKFRVRRRWWRR